MRGACRAYPFEAALYGDSMNRLVVSLVVTSLALAAGAATATAATPASTLAYHGLDADRVGTVYNAKPDGKPDGHFTLTVAGAGAAQTVAAIELSSGTGGVWDTLPQGSYAVLAVYRSGKRLNPGDEGVKDAVSGAVTYELSAGDYRIFGNGSGFTAKVLFADGSSVTSGKSTAATAAAPLTPPAGAGTTTAATSTEPDLHQAVPDFWVALSASVITHNTLGLGRDLALTTTSSNNQVLTVTVLERATGCMVQGATVEIRDPRGALVPGTRMQTRAGVIDIGGLRFQKAGLYHVWVTARDVAGKVVLQAYLPLQVKDRQGQPFQTLNGRPFTFQGGQWAEGARTTASVRSTQSAAGDLFAPFVTAFQQLVAGIAKSILGPAQKAKAATATLLLGDARTSPNGKVQAVQSKTGMVPAFLVTGPAEAAEARAADVSPAKVSLITNDGGSLITNDGGSLVAAGGNIVSRDGAGLTGRSTQSAFAQTGSCLKGFKAVGQGKVQVVDGSSVLAGDDGKLAAGTLVIGGRNAMPVNGFVK